MVPLPTGMIAHHSSQQPSLYRDKDESMRRYACACIPAHASIYVLGLAKQHAMHNNSIMTLQLPEDHSQPSMRSRRILDDSPSIETFTVRTVLMKVRRIIG